MIRVNFIIVFLIVYTFTGCATVIKGYVSELIIQNPSESLSIYSTDGVKYPTMYASKRIAKYGIDDSKNYILVPDTTGIKIMLRSSKEHMLIFKDKENEYRYIAYPKIGVGWLLIDVFTGFVPFIIDISTGNWNYFDPVDYSQLRK